MSRKGKRRREARRTRREHVAASAGAPEAPPPAREAVAPPSAAPARRPAPKKRKAGPRFRLSGTWGWVAGGGAVVAVVAVVLVLVLTGGSSQSSGAGGPTPTPDPRVAGLPIDQSLAVEASDKGSGAEDSFFRPDTLTAKAGDVIEITVTNTGSVLHNLRVSGPDKEFDTADDFAMPPNRVEKGKTERLVVKIDQPGTYPFRCDFHPLWQKGTLVLQ